MSYTRAMLSLRIKNYDGKVVSSMMRDYNRDVAQQLKSKGFEHIKEEYYKRMGMKLVEIEINEKEKLLELRNSPDSFENNLMMMCLKSKAYDDLHHQNLNLKQEVARLNELVSFLKVETLREISSANEIEKAKLRAERAEEDADFHRQQSKRELQLAVSALDQAQHIERESKTKVMMAESEAHFLKKTIEEKDSKILKLEAALKGEAENSKRTVAAYSEKLKKARNIAMQARSVAEESHKANIEKRKTIEFLEKQSEEMRSEVEFIKSSFLASDKSKLGSIDFKGSRLAIEDAIDYEKDVLTSHDSASPINSLFPSRYFNFDQPEVEFSQIEEVIRSLAEEKEKAGLLVRRGAIMRRVDRGRELSSIEGNYPDFIEKSLKSIEQ